MAEARFEDSDWGNQGETSGARQTPIGERFFDLYEGWQAGEWHQPSTSWTSPTISALAISSALSDMTYIARKETSSRPIADYSIDLYLALLRKSDSALSTKGIIDRIEELRRLASEEGPEQLAPSTESVRGLIKFLYLNSSIIVNRPRLVLTYSGNIRAEWRKRFNDRLVVEFLNSIDVKFVFIRPNVEHRTKINRSSGTSTVDTLLQELGISEL